MASELLFDTDAAKNANVFATAAVTAIWSVLDDHQQA